MLDLDAFTTKCETNSRVSFWRMIQVLAKTVYSEGYVHLVSDLSPQFPARTV